MPTVESPRSRLSKAPAAGIPVAGMNSKGARLVYSSWYSNGSRSVDGAREEGLGVGKRMQRTWIVTLTLTLIIGKEKSSVIQVELMDASSEFVEVWEDVT